MPARNFVIRMVVVGFVISRRSREISYSYPLYRICRSPTASDLLLFARLTSLNEYFTTLEFKVNEQVWPLDKPFRIARGVRTEARVIVVQ